MSLTPFAPARPSSVAPNRRAPLRDTFAWLHDSQFGLRVFEGYVATETTPALTMNTPMHNRLGAVGRPLPGIMKLAEGAV